MNPITRIFGEINSSGIQLIEINILLGLIYSQMLGKYVFPLLIYKYIQELLSLTTRRKGIPLFSFSLGSDLPILLIAEERARTNWAPARKTT